MRNLEVLTMKYRNEKISPNLVISVDLTNPISKSVWAKFTLVDSGKLGWSFNGSDTYVVELPPAFNGTKILPLTNDSDVESYDDVVSLKMEMFSDNILTELIMTDEFKIRLRKLVEKDVGFIEGVSVRDYLFGNPVSFKGMFNRSELVFFSLVGTVSKTMDVSPFNGDYAVRLDGNGSVFIQLRDSDGRPLRNATVIFVVGFSAPYNYVTAKLTVNGEEFDLPMGLFQKVVWKVNGEDSYLIVDISGGVGTVWISSMYVLDDGEYGENIRVIWGMSR